MKIGVVIHGPEVVDEGEAEEAVKRLKAANAGFKVEAALGGITGKTAVVDAGLRRLIDISKDLRPSEVVRDFVARGIDFVVLVNRAKTSESGFRLGEGILRNFFETGGTGGTGGTKGGATATAKISFLQLEFCGRRILRWVVKPGDEEVCKRLTRVFSEFRVEEVAESKHELGSRSRSRCRRDARSGLVYREIRGVSPGEKIVVDGVVVGVASQANAVTLVAREGRLVEILGGTLIKHNLEKLPSLDLEREMVKTASVIRRTRPRRRGKKEKSKGGKRKKKACFFYTVEGIFPRLVGRGAGAGAEAGAEEAEVAVAVTVGDDTTSIAGDILKRFGVRLIGITDGDADGLIDGIKTGALEEYEKFLPPGSVVVRLKPETDDLVGQRVKAEIFKGGEEIELEGVGEEEVARWFEELKRRVLELAGEEVVGVLSSSTYEG